MVVPPCLRSPANSILRAAAIRTITNSTKIPAKCAPPASSSSAINPLSTGSLTNLLRKVQITNYSSTTTTLRNEDDGIVDALEGSSKQNSSMTSQTALHNNSTAEVIWNEFQALKSSKTPGGGDYLRVLKQLSEARDFVRCRSVFDEIKAAGMAVDSEIYSLCLNSGRRTLRANEIRELFGDNINYNSNNSEFNNNRNQSYQQQPQQGSSFTRSQFYEQISGLVEEMRSAGIRPTTWFYEELANFLTAINQAGVLVNLATAMEKRGEAPSTKFYNRMLHCLPRCGLLDRAGMLFNRMVLRGQADYYTYLVRASSLVYVNQMEAARAVLTDMKSKFPMDTIAYNILIKSYLAQGNCEQAVAVFKQMTRGDPSIAPNRITCRTFLSYFYDSANLTHSEPIVGYFERANFPETLEDYANVIKFFARYDPPKVGEIFEKVSQKFTPKSSPLEKNQIHHAFLRILNDRQVTNDWKKVFSNLILNSQISSNSNSNPNIDNNTDNTNDIIANTNNPLLSPELPHQFKEIVSKIESPDSVTYEIVMKKLLQLRRYEATKRLYNSVYSGAVAVQPVHRNLYLTALLAGREFEAARDFINEMQTRRIPISGKNTLMLEEAGIELPRGALTAKKGQGVSVVNRRPSIKTTKESEPELNLI